ncbi:hypothetical protein, partial [Ectopseudomonas guguanensis]|uniref:hypothetical protein n=1 Tax=Ectopseudomonas guguanensis TaxID=1198456 RepID=UPI0028A5F48F
LGQISIGRVGQFSISANTFPGLGGCIHCLGFLPSRYTRFRRQRESPEPLAQADYRQTIFMRHSLDK